MHSFPFCINVLSFGSHMYNLFGWNRVNIIHNGTHPVVHDGWFLIQTSKIQNSMVYWTSTMEQNCRTVQNRWVDYHFGLVIYLTTHLNGEKEKLSYPVIYYRSADTNLMGQNNATKLMSNGLQYTFTNEQWCAQVELTYLIYHPQ